MTMKSGFEDESLRLFFNKLFNINSEGPFFYTFKLSKILIEEATENEKKRITSFYEEINNYR